MWYLKNNFILMTNQEFIMTLFMVYFFLVVLVIAILIYDSNKRKSFELTLNDKDRLNLFSIEKKFKDFKNKR